MVLGFPSDTYRAQFPGLSIASSVGVSFVPPCRGTRGSERGLVMALVSAVVLGVVYLRERRRVAIG